MDAKQVYALAAEWYGVALEDAAAERLAANSAAITDTLATVGGRSLFDTEPAHFERALVAMAKRDD
ncbi:MAG: hypothetical protein WD767_05630 [Alphaproteobacteria bacterium]